MARHRLDSLHDFARRGYNARFTCGACSHSIEANAVLLVGEIGAARAKWPVERLGERMKCSRCGHRGATVQACEINF